jgi:hypothetical protein
MNDRHPLLIAVTVVAGAVLAAGPAAAQTAIDLNIGTVSAPAPGVIAVPVHLVQNGAQPSTVVFRVSFAETLLRPVGVIPGTAAQAAQKTSSYLSKDSVLNVVVYGGADVIADGLLAQLVFTVAPEAIPGQSLVLGAAGADAATPEALPLAVNLVPGAIQTETRTGHHTADASKDWSVSLSELLRVIQFFNTGRLHCAPGTEDGYAPYIGDQSCAPHRSDYAPQDWVVNLSELLRLIQFFNTLGGSYHPDPAGEDGFAPGPF